MSLRALQESQSAELGSSNAANPDIDGVPLASPHEHAWREALRGFTDPNLFTVEMYRAHVEGKPELDGAWATLDALGVPDARRLGVLYADRKQKWLEYLVQDGGVAAFHNRVAE
jgi:hypothetical protein